MEFVINGIIESCFVGTSTGSEKPKLSLFSFSAFIPIRKIWNPKTSNPPGICKTGRWFSPMYCSLPGLY
ncbi:hypothetical protein BV917_12795 [Leptospira santarosai serovar Guaricura]|nr:hypothetical protein BV917_12795 [Leptospira santarosai serovar Guaricura]